MTHPAFVALEANNLESLRKLVNKDRAALNAVNEVRRLLRRLSHAVHTHGVWMSGNFELELLPADLGPTTRIAGWPDAPYLWQYPRQH